MTAALPQRWRCAERSMLAWADWGDERVVYDDRSGMTHLLSAGAAAVLDTLADHEHGLTLDALYAEAAGADTVPADDELQALSALLLQLEHLRLVDRRGA